jgi:predicted ATPase
VQLARLTVDGLFGRYNHDVPFPTRPEDSGGASAASVTILHGHNGVGKTTLLRMLDGIMRMDFDIFRRVPFRRCELAFSTGDRVTVLPSEDGGPLRVTFLDMTAALSPAHPGAFEESGSDGVEAWRRAFQDYASALKFNFIDTSRLEPEPESRRVETIAQFDEDGEIVGERRVPRRLSGPRDTRPRAEHLALRIARFIRDAQVNYRQFFGSERELFPRIMRRLSEGEMPQYEADDLGRRLREVREQAGESDRLGLATEPWDYDELMGYLTQGAASEHHTYALTVVGAYTEFLESRAEQRELVVERLLRFEKIVNGFLLDKKVSVYARDGLTIRSSDGTQIRERHLSSGERHLLYLMVAALTTERRGTVIAIDEPELSMHIAWQRKLISELTACASNASPQFIFATHSPEVIANFRDDLVPITAD